MSHLLTRLRRSRALLVLVGLSLLAAGAAHAAKSTDELEVRLLWSLESDRSGGQPLTEAATPVPVGQELYVWAEVTGAPMARVRFFLDSPDARGRAIRTDDAAPYDLVGADLLGTPIAFRTDDRAPGPLAITAEAVRRGDRGLVTGVFDLTAPGDPEPPVGEPTEHVLHAPVDPDGLTVAADGRSVELGVEFSVDEPAEAVGLQVRLADGGAGPYRGSIWTLDGRALTNVWSDGPGADGWWRLDFTHKATLAPGVPYVASLYTFSGTYAAVPSGFQGPDLVAGPLRAPGDERAEVGNGRFAYDRTQLPTQTFDATDYLVSPIVLVGGESGLPEGPPPPPGPARGWWPGPDTTGPNNSLRGQDPVPLRTIADGDVTLDQPGQVLEDVLLDGHCIFVSADDVVIRNVLVRSAPDCGSNLVHIAPGVRGVLLEDVELDGLDSSGFGAAVGDEGYTCRRCDIHSIGVGLRLDGGAVVDSWIHDIFELGDSHNEAIISNGPTIEVDDDPDNPFVTIEHNVLENPNGQTSAISLFGDDGAITRVLVVENLLSGGGYVVYGGSTLGSPEQPKAFGGQAADVVVLDNQFSRAFFPDGGQFGPVSDFDSARPGNRWTGNLWADTAEPIFP